LNNPSARRLTVDTYSIRRREPPCGYSVPDIRFAQT